MLLSRFLTGVKRIIRKVVEEPRTTCGLLQKDTELAGTIVSKKKISNILNCHGPYACSLRKTPLLKYKRIKAYLKFASQNMDKSVKYWENIVWQDETKTWRGGLEDKWHCTSPQKHHSNRKKVGTSTSSEILLKKLCCYLPGWRRRNKGGHFSKTMILNTQPRKLSIGFIQRKYRS